MPPSGLPGNSFDEVFFSESLAPPGTSIVRRISVSRSRQNANLQEIKALMAREAKACGANAIVGFRYGQRSHKWWQQAFTLKWDTESWFGEGDAVNL